MVYDVYTRYISSYLCTTSKVGTDTSISYSGVDVVNASPYTRKLWGMDPRGGYWLYLMDLGIRLLCSIYNSIGNCVRVMASTYFVELIEHVRWLKE